jgi:hypothetical protein
MLAVWRKCDREISHASTRYERGKLLVITTVAASVNSIVTPVVGGVRSLPGKVRDCRRDCAALPVRPRGGIRVRLRLVEFHVRTVLGQNNRLEAIPNKQFHAFENISSSQLFESPTQALQVE